MKRNELKEIELLTTENTKLYEMKLISAEEYEANHIKIWRKLKFLTMSDEEKALLKKKVDENTLKEFRSKIDKLEDE